jgi:hypothetical protein
MILTIAYYRRVRLRGLFSLFFFFPSPSFLPFLIAPVPPNNCPESSTTPRFNTEISSSSSSQQLQDDDNEETNSSKENSRIVVMIRRRPEQTTTTILSAESQMLWGIVADSLCDWVIRNKNISYIFLLFYIIVGDLNSNIEATLATISGSNPF